jgi:short-subunit dehydrogenase
MYGFFFTFAAKKMKQISIITGGASGLGKALANALLNKGMNVCVVSRDAKKIVSAIQELPKGGADVVSYSGDVGDEAFVSHLFEDLKLQGYYVNYLYNNAGVALFGEAKEMNMAKIQKVFHTNTIGVMLMAYEACRSMNEGGTIINISSTSGLKGNPKESLYCASKWAVRGFTEALKAEYKGKDINVIGVYPGGMKTPFWSGDCGHCPDTSTWMDPAEVAEVIVQAVLRKETLCVKEITIERK